MSDHLLRIKIPHPYGIITQTQQMASATLLVELADALDGIESEPLE